MGGDARSAMAPPASPLMAATSLAPVIVLSISCEDEPPADLAVIASCTTWPADDL